MPDLKTYYDAAIAADTAHKAIVAQVDAAMALGTPEGDAQAIALNDALDQALATAKAKNRLYVSMRDSSLTGENIAANFTEAVDPAASQGDKKIMPRAAFAALDPQAQMTFIKARGKVVDEVSNG